MKLAMFRHESRALRPALISEDGVHDICQHIPAAPSDMVALIEQIDAFTSALARLGKGIADYKLSDVTLAAPVTRPGKIMALGLNYRDHAAEASMDLPEIQTWFSKMTSSINGPYDSIDLPKVSDKLDYEDWQENQACNPRTGQGRHFWILLCQRCQRPRFPVSQHPVCCRQEFRYALSARALVDDGG